MRAPDGPAVTVEPLAGQRVVADSSTIDAAVEALPVSATAWRVAPDEVFMVGATVRIDDPDAIVEDETGFVAITVDVDVVARHTEWPMPPAGGFAQGAIAGVPAKLAWFPDGRARIVIHAGYVADLLDRLT